MSDNTLVSDHQAGVEKLAKMIKGIKYAMLSTVDQDGTIRSRPMATQDVDFDGTLWFFTRATSPKVEELEQEHQVNVSYADPSGQSYVSISGSARMVRDQAKNKELWNAAMKAWFPKGPEDPETVLLRIDARKAEYWDTPSSAVVHVFGFVHAILTGKAAHIGENEKIAF